jgi:hypothetical protein
MRAEDNGDPRGSAGGVGHGRRSPALDLNSGLRLRFRTSDGNPAARLRVASELLDSDHPTHQAAGRAIYTAAQLAQRLGERDQRLAAGRHPGSAAGRYCAALAHAQRWGLAMAPAQWPMS